MSEGGATTARSESSASALSGTAAQQQPRKPLKSRPSMATEKKGVEGASTVTDGGASRAIAPPRAKAQAEGVKSSPRLVTASATRSAAMILKGIETADGKNADGVRAQLQRECDSPGSRACGGGAGAARAGGARVGLRLPVYHVQLAQVVRWELGLANLGTRCGPCALCVVQCASGGARVGRVSILRGAARGALPAGAPPAALLRAPHAANRDVRRRFCVLVPCVCPATRTPHSLQSNSLHRLDVLARSLIVASAQKECNVIACCAFAMYCHSASMRFSLQDCVLLWNAATLEVLRELLLEEHMGSVTCLAFEPSPLGRDGYSTRVVFLLMSLICTDLDLKTRSAT